MKRRQFLISSALGALSLHAGRDALAAAEPRAARLATRKILIAGGGFNAAFIRYMAQLTGKTRPKILYLPTASADSPGSFMDAVVAGGAGKGVGMHNEVSRSCFDNGGAIAAFIDAAQPTPRLHENAVGRNGGRDASVDGVDDAADRL